MNEAESHACGDAFDWNPPELAFSGTREPAQVGEQKGFAFIFKEAMLGVRDPKAHAHFCADFEERRALDYLGFASFLMQRLDDVQERLDGAA